MIRLLRACLLLIAILGFYESAISQTLTARDDKFIAFLNCNKTKFDVLRNDDFSPACELEIKISAGITKHGTFDIIDSKVAYSAELNYLGKDTIEYTIKCDGESSTAKVYIEILPKPDNIDDISECYIENKDNEWSIEEWKRIDGVHHYAQPLVGDIDNDGVVEIVAPVSTGGRSATCNGFLIINAETGSKYKINTTEFNPGYGGVHALADVDGDGNAEIFVISTNKYIYAYNKDGTPFSKWTKPWTSVPIDGSYTSPIYVVDINNDGVPEIICSNKIFNSLTGELILTINLSSGEGMGVSSGHDYTHRVSIWGIGDMDGDGDLELVGGFTVYDINLNNGSTSGTCTVKTSLNSLGAGKPAYVKDGFTALADVDLDGDLDVVVIARNFVANSPVYVYVWDGQTTEIMGNYEETPIGDYPAAWPSGKPREYGPSPTFIGNINSTKNPEIVFSMSLKMIALEYIEGVGLKNLWTKETSDRSGATVMTLFDFDLNGEQELVYRDETDLRIMDGKGENLKTFPCFSGTVLEYPVVADVDRDGRAEIIVAGIDMDWGVATSGVGSIRIYKSEPGKQEWAPARPVWNQYMYSGVNVNNDLTIPKYQLNPSTLFPGEDGVFGTIDDVRPYNGVLMQHTSLSRDGFPLFLTPNAHIEDPEPSFSYSSKTDILTITINIENSGDASLNKPRITVYQDVVDASSNKYVYQHSGSIAKKTSEIITFKLPNFSTWIKNGKENTILIVKINDDGHNENFQEVCKEANTTAKPVLYIDFIDLNKDDTIVFASGNSILIDVLNNDSIIAGSKLTIASSDVGTATIENNKIKYLVSDCKHGGYSNPIKYSVCNVTETYCDTTTLRVGILPCPKIRLKNKCSFNPKMKSVNYIEGANYQWQSSGDGITWADISGETNETCSILTPQHYKLQVKYKNLEAESSPVELKIIKKEKINNIWWYETELIE